MVTRSILQTLATTMEPAAAEAAAAPLSPLEAVQALLVDRLPALGLDVETYGPYIVSLLPTVDSNVASNVASDITATATPIDFDLVEGDSLDTLNNAEEWESVLELLQASSDSHSEDTTVWTALQRDIVDTFTRQVRLEQHFRRAQFQQDEAQRIAHEQEERHLALKAAEVEQLEQERKLAAANQTICVQDEVKRALVSRFAYEEDDDEEKNGTTTAAAASALPPILNNRDVAKQVEVQKAQELRAHKTQTKREEQAKTKESKLHKEKLKEARQQRAVKGERRR
jgi:hypothetical protein